MLSGCSKRLLIAPAQSRRAETRLSTGKAAASEAARHTPRYVEPLSDARTPLADFFSILLEHPFDRATGRRIEFPGNAAGFVSQTTGMNRILHRFRHGKRVLCASNR